MTNKTETPQELRKRAVNLRFLALEHKRQYEEAKHYADKEYSEAQELEARAAELEAQKRTGKVMKAGDIINGVEYWFIGDQAEVIPSKFLNDKIDKRRISFGNAFHDETSARRARDFAKAKHLLESMSTANWATTPFYMTSAHGSSVTLVHFGTKQEMHAAMTELQNHPDLWVEWSGG